MLDNQTSNELVLSDSAHLYIVSKLLGASLLLLHSRLNLYNILIFVLHLVNLIL